jgi:hypothetical protein
VITHYLQVFQNSRPRENEETRGRIRMRNFEKKSLA